MATLQFSSILQIRGVNPYVIVTKDQASTLRADWRKPMPVLVRVNGRPHEPWRINMMPTGTGDFYLYLHGTVRKAAGVQVGDKIEIALAFDKDYQNGPQHPMPDEFAAALAEHPTAQAHWNMLPPSRQKEVLRHLATLKSTDAKTRNISQALLALSGEPTHFMGRDWINGR